MQTTLSHSLFHSRIGRRIVGLFVLCALVPTSLLGWISYRQVTEQLVTQSTARLKQESKSQGMVLYNHLLTLTADLSHIAAELPSDGIVTEEVAITQSVQELAQRFRNARLLPVMGPQRRELRQAQMAHLQEGKSLLEIQFDANHSPQLTLTRLVNPARWEAGLLSAQVDDTALWSTQAKENLPGNTDLVIEDEEHRPLYSTFSQPITLPDFSRHDIAAPMGDGVLWHMGGQEYISGAWSMPLQHTFLIGSWIIVLNQTRASALAPVEQFRHTFLLVIAFALSAVALLSFSQIRRSLHPVTILKEGTTRLANGDFSTHVTVHSDDEFEELADSFNSMTQQLSQQFQMLETISAISQAILACHEPAIMVKILLARITETIDCAAVGMTLIDPEETGPSVMSMRFLNDHSKNDVTDSPCQLSEEDRTALQTSPHHMLVSSSCLPAYLKPMDRPDLLLFTIFPIMVNEGLSGVLILAYHERKRPPADDMTQARRLADQITVALTNIRATQVRVQTQIELTGALQAKQQAEQHATNLQARTQSLETKEERLRHQQSATLALVQDCTVFEGALPVTARQLTTIAAEALAVQRVSVWIYDDQTQSLYCLDQHDRVTDQHTFGGKLIRGLYPHYIAALNEGQLITAAEALQHQAFKELATEILAPNQIGARLDVPFHTRRKLAGVISIEHVGSSRDWAPDEQQFAQALANFMTLVLEAARRRESEEALTIAKLAAEDATKAKAEFLANMTHEIRTPMNGIIGMTEILGRSPLSETQRHYVETIHNSGDVLLALINDILDFSKIEAGKLEIQPLPIDVRDIVERTVEQLAESAQQKGLHILTDYDPSVPTAVMGDPIRIRQIVTNLLSNAIKFTQSGEVIVSVTQEPTPSHQEIIPRITLAVTDTGSGISPEGQARLFQSFSQVDGSSTRVHGGTGLGLSICKQLSELMGGTIGVESAIGEGSTFWVTLPLPMQAETTAPPQTNPLFGNLRICVAVSHPGTRRVLSRYFASWGISPRMADTEAEFLEQVMTELATDERRVIALVDETFADTTDTQLLQALDSDSALESAKVLRLISSIRRTDVEQDPAFGQRAFVTKPLRYHALHQALTNLLADKPLELQSTEAAPATPILSGHILLGEDNPVNQEIALVMLETMGCTATVAQNGREVLTCAKTTSFDLILMDCQMPEMDGFEATRLIREWEQAESRTPVPIIALTAHATPDDREQCLAAGMNDYLAKPYTMERLQAMLTSWLRTGPMIGQVEQSASHRASSTTSVPISSSSDPASQASLIVDQKSWKSITSLQRPGKEDLLTKLLSLYLVDSKDLVTKIALGMADGNAQAVYHAAHSLKSRSSVLGAVSLSKLCKQFEDLGRHGELKEVEPLLNQLRVAFDHASQLFQAELERRSK